MEASATGAFPLPENSPVMVLDDDASLVQLLERYLARQGYPVRGHASVHDALIDLARDPAALLVLDLGLGSANGLDVARAALEEDPTISIVMITGGGSESDAVEALRMGLADYVQKPFSLEDLESVIQRCLLRRASELRRHDNEQRLRNQLSTLRRESRGAAIEALCEVVRTLEQKHPYLRGHSARVASLAEAMALDLELPRAQAQRLRIAGLLHDVGMISAPDEALCSNAALSPADRERVRNHTRLGASLARSLGLGTVADLIEMHHERLDGSGYPQGLSGTDIPVGALMLGLAESYAALTEVRPYREAGTPSEAIETLKGAVGVWFPARLIGALEVATKTVSEDDGARGSLALELTPVP